MPRGRMRAILVASFLLAAILRLEYLRELAGSPFWRHLQLDAEWYHRAALGILNGSPLAEGEAYFRPPLYPLFLAFLLRLFGRDPSGVRVVQALLGIAQVWMCWRVALRTHGERVAALTALLAASYGMFVYFEGEILATALGTALTTAGTLLLLEGDARGSLVRFAAGGCCLGFAAITHATALALVPAAVGWTLFGGGRRGPRGEAASAMRWGVREALTVLAATALPVGVVTARNAVAAGEFVPISSQGGINFYIGNNALSDGKSALAPGFAEASLVMGAEARSRDTVEMAARVLAERETGRPLGAGEVNRFWFARGISWMREQPKKAGVLFLRKIVFFWNGFEISNNRDLRDQARRFTPILRFFLVQYAFLLPFGLFGVLRGGRPRRLQILLLAFLGVYTVAIALFFVCSRYRQPAVPWLLPFGAAGMLAFLEDVRRAQQRRGQAVFSGALLAGLFVVTNGGFVSRSGLADVTAERDAPFHRFNLAVLYEQEGDLDRAIREYRAAAATGVADPRIHLNLGNTLARTGRGEEARREYAKVLRLAPDYAGAVRSNLGILAAQEGDWEEAIRQFRACLEIDPLNRNALTGLAAACLSAGRYDEAIVAYRTALQAHSAPQALLRRSLAVAYLEAGLPEDAEREALAVLRLSPEDVLALLTLGRVHVQRGEEEAAARMFRRALEIAPNVPAVRSTIEKIWPGFGAKERAAP